MGFSLVRLQDTSQETTPDTSGEKTPILGEPPALLRAPGILAVSIKKQNSRIYPRQQAYTVGRGEAEYVDAPLLE